MKPTVIGIYGIPGAGKTTLLGQLQVTLGEDHFMYFEGSEEVCKQVAGGLESFKKLGDRSRQTFRSFAVNNIKRKCMALKKAGVVTGHLMFWNEGQDAEPVYTQTDWDTFTHIIYLDVPPEEILKRRLNDTNRARSNISVNHVQRWVEVEKRALRQLCYRHSILFCAVSPSMIPKDVERLVCDFITHDEGYNLLHALSVLDNIPAVQRGILRRMIVFDADRTLASQDTGAMFWDRICPPRRNEGEQPSKTPAQVVFESPLGYTYNAFRQVTLLHEEKLRDDDYDAVCKSVALSVTMDGAFVNLLHTISEQDHVAAVVVTCGLAQVWRYVLEVERLQDKITVIGGGRISDGLVVSPGTKESLVDHLKTQHLLEVWAFGDSPLDLKMLSRADRAFVVVREEETRSRSMDFALQEEIENHRLKAEQCLRPSSVPPRLTKEILPEINITDPDFISSLLLGYNEPTEPSESSESSESTVLKVISADKLNPEAVKMLMTPMRNADVQGPRLRKAHSNAGWFLGITYLPWLVSIEPITMPHPQGHPISGYQLLREEKMVIVALMRGGEPMASGVNDAFEQAMLVHAKQPTDLHQGHIEDRSAILLVDSVVNSGRTVLDFVRHIRDFNHDAPIVVITGVIQARCISGEGLLNASLAQDANLHFLTLRISENMYKGTRATDTGNRLFNTLHLP
ncbi:uracil phosphoribosyltransferase-domain-containing protein [Aspergillus bertholletiae]|uniref:Uracil phosphoribosyltransferase-domain-containing protein n=1 Tax=Aspergillus bertholletiae TaxID=1226010 RepID=A0A5N7BM86_9EURO|nr:uracil phosphoribosyltransferase-domain-containing protein [Aspergillus bertholletiae]